MHSALSRGHTAVIRLLNRPLDGGVSGGAFVCEVNADAEETKLMKTGQVALGVTGGYLLGRFHKMRWAMGVAGALAGKRLRSLGGGQAGQALRSPEISRLSQDIRGDLASAGRAAAVAAASRRMNSLSDRMEEKAAALRGRPGAADEEAGTEQGGEEQDARDRESAAGEGEETEARGSGGRSRAPGSTPRTTGGGRRSPKGKGSGRTSPKKTSSRAEGGTAKAATGEKSDGRAKGRRR